MALDYLFLNTSLLLNLNWTIFVIHKINTLNMKRNNIQQWMLVFVAFLLFTSCKSPMFSYAKRETTIENGAIPPDFGKEDVVMLCVLAGYKAYDKQMKKQVSENYFGKYEFITKKQINSSQYENVEKFRYLFDSEEGAVNTPSHDSRGERLLTYDTDFTFIIVDRKNKVTYKSPFKTITFPAVIEAYMINLEALRLANNGK